MAGDDTGRWMNERLALFLENRQGLLKIVKASFLRILPLFPLLSLSFQQITAHLSSDTLGTLGFAGGSSWGKARSFGLFLLSIARNIFSQAFLRWHQRSSELISQDAGLRRSGCCGM